MDEKMLAEIERIKEHWPEGSDLAGVGTLLALNISLLFEIRAAC